LGLVKLYYDATKSFLIVDYYYVIPDYFIFGYSVTHK